MLGLKVATGGVWPAEKVDEGWYRIVSGTNVVPVFVLDGVMV
jgi:hypothetical protein